MNPSGVINETKSKLDGAMAHFSDELKKLRTGRAHASMLDGVKVMAYGQPMPLNQVSNVTAPEAQLLQITPFDPGNLQAIASAIRDDQALGLNPTDDGRVVRVPIPALNTERRQQIVKQLNEKTEECFITARQIRQDALKQFDQAKKDKVISEDDQKRYEKQVEDMMTKLKVDVDSLAKAKEQEIMTV